MKLCKNKGTIDDYYALERMLVKAVSLKDIHSIQLIHSRIYENYTGCEFWIYRDFNIDAINVLFSKKYKIGFIPIPKVGCTSLKHLLFYIDFDRNFYLPYNYIHDYYGYPAYTIEDIINFFSDYTIFTFLRNPIERFVSAYIDRIVIEKAISEINNSQNKFYQIKNIDILVSEYFVSEFLMNIDFYKYISDDIRHHFSSQFSFIKNYDKIEHMIKFYYFPYDIPLFEKHLLELLKIKRDIRLPHLHFTKKINFLNRNLIKLIEEVYQEDFNLIDKIETFAKFKKNA